MRMPKPRSTGRFRITLPSVTNALRTHLVARQLHLRRRRRVRGGSAQFYHERLAQAARAAVVGVRDQHGNRSSVATRLGVSAAIGLRRRDACGEGEIAAEPRSQTSGDHKAPWSAGMHPFGSAPWGDQTGLARSAARDGGHVTRQARAQHRGDRRPDLNCPVRARSRLARARRSPHGRVRCHKSVLRRTRAFACCATLHTLPDTRRAACCAGGERRLTPTCAHRRRSHARRSRLTRPGQALRGDAARELDGCVTG